MKWFQTWQNLTLFGGGWGCGTKLVGDRRWRRNLRWVTSLVYQDSGLSKPVMLYLVCQNIVIILVRYLVCYLIVYAIVRTTEQGQLVSLLRKAHVVCFQAARGKVGVGGGG